MNPARALDLADIFAAHETALVGSADVLAPLAPVVLRDER